MLILVLSHFVPAPLIRKSLAPCPAQMWEEGAWEWGWETGCCREGEGSRFPLDWVALLWPLMEGGPSRSPALALLVCSSQLPLRP